MVVETQTYENANMRSHGRNPYNLSFQFISTKVIKS
jgi:hypothetical protein